MMRTASRQREHNAFSLKSVSILSGLILTLVFSAGPACSVSVEGPACLTFKELNSLTTDTKNVAALNPKIKHLLITPFIYRDASLAHKTPAPFNAQPDHTPTLRVASWNIERGFQLPHILEVFSKKNTGNGAANTETDAAQAEAEWLARSQVIFLTEVDNGMNRTNYQNVTEIMASTLHMNAVYGVEFLELGPLFMRQQQLAHAKSVPVKKPDPVAKPDPELIAYNEAAKIDPAKYRGLHGSAILTRYPILKVEMIRLPDVYDWYTQERKKLSALEKVRRTAADKVLLEDVLTEVRLGSRMALAVDLEIPELPEHKATFVVVHLENRVKPEGRKIQMDYLLNTLKDRHNPVVLGGDFNTTGTDVSPTSIKKEVRRYASDPAFWARRAVGYFSPFGLLINLGLSASQFTKNVFDPAAPDIPLLLPNKEHALFTDIKDFQFTDQTVFDTRGNQESAYEHNGGFLGNSNQRWLKGFVPTFSVERPLFKGLIGKYKLDWFFVKAYLTRIPAAPKQAKAATDKITHPGKLSSDTKKPAEEQSALFAPRYGRTLSAINHLYPEKLSDHSPITVDLPLVEPVKTLPDQPKDKPQDQQKNNPADKNGI